MYSFFSNEFSGRFIPKSFVNAENQSFFRFFFDAVRLLTWMIVSMYGAALFCTLLIAGPLVNHGANPDSAF
jgi:hypothetical protein